MKNAVILLMLLSMFFNACHERRNNNKHTKTEDNKHAEAEWKNRFKDLVFCNCVITGISDSAVRMKFLMTDKSFHDPIHIIMEDDIKQLLNPIIKQIKTDSINSLTTVSEGAQGKKVFDNCIKFYKSKQLDTLTSGKLLKWNRTNLDSVMSVKAPAY
jgi:hypothetical protein